MYTKATMSVLGMYNTDSTLFDLIHLPEDLDHDVLVNNILMECSELEVLYTNPSFLKFAIDNWSKKELPVWQKLTDLWSSEMDLSGEYDYERKRLPNLSHTKTGTETQTPSGSIIDSGTVGSTTTDSVSAYNSNSFENREQSVVNGTNGNTRTFQNYQDQKSYNTINAETGTETITEKGHKKPMYELIAGASDVAQNNIYDYIVESFKTRFCILVY